MKAPPAPPPHTNVQTPNIQKHTNTHIPPTLPSQRLRLPPTKHSPPGDFIAILTWQGDIMIYFQYLSIS